MKNSTLKHLTCIAIVAIAVPLVLALSGCGNDDSKPPSDPSYYTGPMKGKDAQAGAKGGE